MNGGKMMNHQLEVGQIEVGQRIGMCIRGVYSSPALEIIEEGMLNIRIEDIQLKLPRTDDLEKYTVKIIPMQNKRYVQSGEPLHCSYGKVLITDITERQEVVHILLKQKKFPYELLVHFSLREDGDYLISKKARYNLTTPFQSDVDRATKELKNALETLIEVR
jgi:hypothetical protein